MTYDLNVNLTDIEKIEENKNNIREFIFVEEGEEEPIKSLMKWTQK